MENEFIGKKLKKYFISSNKSELMLHFEDGSTYIFYHMQDCCESVYIDDIKGDLNDLIGKEIIKFEEKTNSDKCEDSWDSFTWTFYDIETLDSHVQIKWLGVSNGYYSESVNLFIVGKGDIDGWSYYLSEEIKQQAKEL